MNDENVGLSSAQTRYIQEMDVILRYGHDGIVARGIKTWSTNVTPRESSRVSSLHVIHVEEEHLPIR